MPDRLTCYSFLINKILTFWIAQIYNQDVSVLPCCFQGHVFHFWWWWMTQTRMVTKQRKEQTEIKIQKKIGASCLIKSHVCQPKVDDSAGCWVHCNTKRCNMVMIARTIRPQKSTRPAEHHQKVWATAKAGPHDSASLKMLWTSDRSLCWRNERKHSKCIKPATYK